MTLTFDLAKRAGAEGTLDNVLSDSGLWAGARLGSAGGEVAPRASRRGDWGRRAGRHVEECEGSVLRELERKGGKVGVVVGVVDGW